MGPCGVPMAKISPLKNSPSELTIGHFGLKPNIRGGDIGSVSGTIDADN